MSRYTNVVVKRKAPFVTDVALAHQLNLELVRLRERFMRIGMVQTFHALEAGQMKAGFELADHLELAARA